MIKLTKAYDVHYENEDETQITMTVEVEGVECIDCPVVFTTTETDTTEHGREWYQRAIAGEFGPIAAYEPFIPSEEALADAAKMFFESEKEIALKIDADYRLDLKQISDEEMQEVKTYLKAIDPESIARHTRMARSIPVRPEIMELYSPRNTTLEE